MLTAALVGCGRISSRHIEAFVRNADRVRLVATCDPVEDRARLRSAEYVKAMAGRAGVPAGGQAAAQAAAPVAAPAVCADYRRMIADARPDVVAIATESGYHARIAIDCLEAGCHVICEKPLALSTADADAVVAASLAAGRMVAVCFQNRFNAAVQRARRALEAGRFGRLLHGSIQVRWNRDESYYAQAPWRGTWALDGGTLMNQCTHGIDLLQWMMGEDAVRVQAATRRFLRPIEAEDYGAAIVEFASGAVGVIEGTADAYPTNLNETLSLFGSRGTVVIGGVAVNRIETWRFADAAAMGDPEERVLDPGAKDPPTVYGFGHADLFADALDSILSGREPLVTAEKGRKALDIILAAYKSQKTGRPVDLPCEFSAGEMAGAFG